MAITRRQFLPAVAGLGAIPLLAPAGRSGPPTVDLTTGSVREVAATATLVAATAGRTLLRTKRPFAGASKYHPTNGYYARGVDATDGALWVIDMNGGLLRQSLDWGTTFSGSKGLPANVGYGSVAKIVRHADSVYLYGKDATTGRLGIYKSPPATAAGTFAWSGPVTTQDSSVTSSLSTAFASDGTYLYLGDYGDPKGGPQLARSRDGATWTTAWNRDPTLRHIHAVAGDPYLPGHVWMTLGDGGSKTIVRSTDFGETWSTVIADYSWQGVQISFDSNWVYIAGDQSTCTYFVIDRLTGTPYSASTNWHHHIQPPGAANATDRYWSNCYLGAVDPSTGFYYCVANDTSGAGTMMGMFYAAGAGSRIEVLDRGGVAISMNGEVLIGGGYVHSGYWRHPLLAPA